MTRPYGEQLGDTLQEIINPPPPHIYFIKNVRDLLEYDGWTRIEIRLGRIIHIHAERDENGSGLAMNQAISYHLLGGMKYPHHAVEMVIASYRRALRKWRDDTYPRDRP